MPLSIIGRERLADIWIITAVVSVLIIPLYGAIVARVRRSVFLPAMYGFVALVLAIVGLQLQGDQINPAVGKFFYVFISVVNLFLLSIFWSFLLELFDGGQSKRLFGVIAAGGSAGALVGPLVSDFSVAAIGNNGLLFLGAALFVAAIVCQRLLLNIWQSLQIETRTTITMLVEGLDLVEIADSHQPIVDAISGGDAELAARVAREHQDYFERLPVPIKAG